MDIKYGKYLEALFELDQLSAQIQGALPLESLFTQLPVETQPHELIGRPCIANPTITCGKSLEEPCTGCPIWNEKDGE